MSETLEHITTETGGVFLGHRQSDIWYVIESIDPGLRATFRQSYFEYDQDYINHIINKINKIYRVPLDLIGLWHRHPGSMDSFSSTDDGTNAQYARLDRAGAISALVNIDPNFRLTVYSVTPPLSYKKISYTVGNSQIPREFLAFQELKDVERRINNYGRPSLDITLEKALSSFLTTFKNRSLREQKKMDISIEENDIEIILEYLQSDLDFFEKAGISYTMDGNGEGAIDIKEKTPGQHGRVTLKLPFFIHREKKLIRNSSGEIYSRNETGKNPAEKIVFKFNDYWYLYSQGLFQRACEACTQSRR